VVLRLRILHGDLNVGSCCCTHRYRPAAFFGGMKAWRYFYDRAHQLGLEVGHWIAGHMSYHAPILREHPEWALKGFTSLTFAGGYPNFELASLNMNTGVRQWILDDLRRWKEEGGLDYVWFDSVGNLDLLPVDYAREMESNAFGVGRFIAGLQKLGLANVAVEGVSPLGMSGASIMDIHPDKDGGVQWIAGQNCWDWYEGNEDMLVGQQPRCGVRPDRTEESVRTRFFRAMANRCVLGLSAYLGPFRPERKWHNRYLDSYFAVEADLVKRRILPDKRGVLWMNGRTRVLFAFKDFELNLGSGVSVEAVQDGVGVPRAVSGRLSAEAWGVYRWQETDDDAPRATGFVCPPGSAPCRR
jgi:hypothetical protein